MSTVIGQAAETKAAEHLVRLGYKILERNWKTRWCEIDIVASKNNVVHFVEVKYRRRPNWGDGLDAITASKLQQMRRAAEIWISQHNWSGEVELSAISLTGEPPEVEELIERLG